MKAIDLITYALQEIGALAQGETPSSDDVNYAFVKLNELIDEWAARKAYVYAMQFIVYTLVPGLSPHTIGPSGATFNATIRPVRIEGATLVLNTSTPTVDVPINVRDDQWWNYLRVKNLQSNLPTDLYYQPDWPNGSLFFWPVPNQNYQVRLETWNAINQIASVDTVISFPQGYEKALRLSLAEDLIPGFEKANPSPVLFQKALLARKAIQGNNDQSPTMMTVEAGMPNRGSSTRSDFNYISGLPV